MRCEWKNYDYALILECKGERERGQIASLWIHPFGVQF